jgi:molybdopterin-guanine dinucleotide biosynthesis protein B
MKVFTVYGTTQTGKTTTIENIIKELKKRGYSVGSIKEIHNEAFAIDTEGTNTDRHKKAGSELVTARGLYETDILFQNKLPVEDILKFYNQDYVVMEGVTDAAVPKIVCATTVEQIEEKLDDTVFAISGVISNELTEYKGIPIINSNTDIKTLTDLIEEKVFDKLPGLDCGHCEGASCAGMVANILEGRATREDCVAFHEQIEVMVNNKKIHMIPFVQDIVKSVIVGALSTLKGYEEGEISIKIK